jgi:hypothetical protein
MADASLMLQVGNVAIHRALGDFKALRQKRRRAQAPSANELDDLKQAVGAAHQGGEVEGILVLQPA